MNAVVASVRPIISSIPARSLGRSAPVATALLISAPLPTVPVRSFGTAKKKKKKSKGGGNPSSGQDNQGGSGTVKRLLKMMDSKPDHPPSQSREVMDRWFEIGRAYNVGMARSNNAVDHDLACKIRMKTLAMESLPPGDGVGTEARRVDSFNPKDGSGSVPLWRHIMSDLPPIKNFDLNDYYKDEKR